MATTNITFPEPLENFFYFVEDQVLTAGQLNQLAGHFDWEHRHARTRTQGIGIVCGLDVRQEGNDTIRISKGAAITSAGDLLQLSAETAFTHYRKIQNTDQAPADGTRLLKIGTEPRPDAVWEMWRLYDQAGDGRLSLSALSGETDLNDLAVVLFLDSYLKDPEVCTDTNCDNMGITQVNETMVLLLPKAALTPPVHNPNRFHQIPHASIVSPRMNGIKGIEDLQNRFETAIGAVGGGNGSLQGIRGTLERICSHYPDIWNTFSTQNPIARWEERLDSIVTGQQNRAGILYVYDFFRDLSEAINEFRESVFELPGECCPPVDLFPKYVMLSEYTLENGSFFPRYRHYFNEAPILNQADMRRDKASFLLLRINIMIESFDIPTPANADAVGQIRITPSRQTTEFLGDRAIPFYYNITDEQPLDQYWSYEKTRRGMALQHQGYRMRDRTHATASVRTPFEFDMAKYDFYRVEGYHGLDAQKAVAEIERQKQEFNLGFKVKSVQMEDSDELLIPPRFFFPELDILHRHYREELYSNLHLVHNFGSTLKTRFNALTEAEKLTLDNVEVLNDSKVIAEIEDATTTTFNHFASGASNMRTMMYQPLNSLASNFTAFRAQYDDTVDLANSMNAKVYYTNQATVAPPTHKLVLDNSFNKFDHLIEYFGKKRTGIIKQHIFDQFYDKNTGLSHQGGVPEGGMLVLLYSSVNKTIVADFYLPYCCEPEMPAVEDHTPPPPLEIRPLPGIIRAPEKFKWIDKFDYYKTPRIPTNIAKFKPDDYLKTVELPKRFDDYVRTNEFKAYAYQDLLHNYASKNELELYATKSDITTNYARRAEIESTYASKGELTNYAKAGEIAAGATTIFNEKYFEIIKDNRGGLGLNQPGNFAGINEGLTRQIELLEDPAEKLQLYQLGLQAEEWRYLKGKGDLQPDETARVEVLEKELTKQLTSITKSVGSDANAPEKVTSARANYLATMAEIAGTTTGGTIIVKSMENTVNAEYNTAINAGNITQVLAMGSILKNISKRGG